MRYTFAGLMDIGSVGGKWRGLSGLTAQELPDGWYVAHPDDGILEGPFGTKRAAIINAGSLTPPKRYGPGLYSVGRLWVIHIQRGVVPGGFEVAEEGRFFNLRVER